MPLIDLSDPTFVLRPSSEVDGARVGFAEAPLAEAEAGAKKDEKPEAAASEPAINADVGAVLIAYGLVLAGIGVGIGLWAWRDPSSFTPGDGISVFAPLYILAQAIERFIEPFSSYLGSAKPDDQADGDKKKKPEAVKLLNEAIVDRDAVGAAKWARVVDKIRRNTAVIAWGIASFLGTVLCGLFGLYMLRLVGFTAVPKQIDIAISGLAVGSGTKPLHDLIGNIQKTKEQKDDPPQKKAA
jgi:hypothetical protein